MDEKLDTQRYRARPPSMLNTLTELPRTLFEISSLVAEWPLLTSGKRGDGHPVLFLPGFMAGDNSTLVMRRFLLNRGYEPLPWLLGTNTGRLELLEEKLVKRAYRIIRTYKGKKISLVGQSLGGIFARELARMFPDSIRQVITLGSPFAARDTGSTFPLVRRMFERASGMSVERTQERMNQMDIETPLPVPATAIYSKGDGIVDWRVCMENEGAYSENIEVHSSHCGMGFNSAIFYILADRLAQEEGEWQKFDDKMLEQLLPDLLTA